MVVEKYIPYSHGHNDATSYHYATHCAIQDRQSVLKFADNVKELLTDSDGHPRVNCIYFDKVKLEITNLTAQIEYLNFC